MNLHILDPDDYASCGFWLTFCPKGDVSFDELHKMGSFKTAMHRASVDGVSGNEQILMIDTTGYGEQTLYILPEFHASTFIEKALWMTGLAKTLKELKVKNLGLFLRDDSFENLRRKQLVIEMFRQLCKSTIIANYYFMVGLQNRNKLINYGLSLKEDLSNESINLTLFH